MASFVLNDEKAINSYGFMILNSGGRLDRFKSNPVLLNGHNHDLVSGKWENLRIEGDQLIADPLFDTEDPESMKLKGKVDRGFLKGASMGIAIHNAELRSVPQAGLIPVVTDWELMEASVVAVPSNVMSLRLYDSSGEQLTPENIKLNINKFIQTKQTMEKVVITALTATTLGLPTECEMKALDAAIAELNAKKEKAEQKLSEHLKAQATQLVDMAVSDGRITADKKDSFVNLAMADYKQAKDILDALPGKKTFSDKTKTAGAGSSGDRDSWDYMKWVKEDPSGLQQLQVKSPETFAELRANYKSKMVIDGH